MKDLVPAAPVGWTDEAMGCTLMLATLGEAIPLFERHPAGQQVEIFDCLFEEVIEFRLTEIGGGWLSDSSSWRDSSEISDRGKDAELRRKVL